MTIYEQTRVDEISPRRVRTAGGRVRADVVVRATEGYTRGSRTTDGCSRPSTR